MDIAISMATALVHDGVDLQDRSACMRDLANRGFPLNHVNLRIDDARTVAYGDIPSCMQEKR